MKNVVRHLAAKVGCRVPVARLLSGRRPVVLTYHGIPPNGLSRDLHARTFERQIVFLKNHFDLVSVDALEFAKRSPVSRIQVLLTFDDGFQNNAEVVAPILRRHHIPAVFFVCSRHASPGVYLWFSYLRALEQWFPSKGFCFRGQYFDMSASSRRASMSKLWSQLLDLQPHPAAMYKAIEEECPRLEDFAPPSGLRDRSAGMPSELVEELSANPLFRIGIHTADHPYLTRCEPAEMRRQIADNKLWIESLTRRKCDLIAYPLGDYCADVLTYCDRLQLRYGFTVDKRIDGDAQLQLFRVGIYRPSLEELSFKVHWASWLRRCKSLMLSRPLTMGLCHSAGPSEIGPD